MRPVCEASAATCLATAAALFASAAAAAPVTVDQIFEGDFSGFQAALAGATFVTVDFETLAAGALAFGTIVPGDVAGASITLVDGEAAIDLGGTIALEIGNLFGVAGTVSFSTPIVGLGATFLGVSNGAFGGAFLNNGFDTDDDGAVNGALGDVAFSAAQAAPTFLGFTALTTFSSIGISSYGSFAVPGQIDDLVFAFYADGAPNGGGGPQAVPLPAGLSLLLAGLGAFALVRRKRAAGRA